MPSANLNHHATPWLQNIDIQHFTQSLLAPAAQNKPMASEKMKLGIVGLGHLGKVHLKCALATQCWQVVGFYEPSDATADQVLATYPDVTRFTDLNALIQACHAIDIVTPTPTHFKIAKQAIIKGRHVFIEKPITQTVREAKALINLKVKYGVKVQVGHVERFNPAYLALHSTPLKPRFVEIHRLAMYQPRGTDVSVVLDLMIHDLDLVLHLMGREVISVHANGVHILSPTEDIANARIEFSDGSVANLTASRISLKQMRKVRVFQEDAYVSMDFLEKKSQIVRLFETDDAAVTGGQAVMPLDTAKGKRFIGMSDPEVAPVNAIVRELETFHEAILNGTDTLVTAEDGAAALDLAHRIMKAIRTNNSRGGIQQAQNKTSKKT
jgi:predicted dehydrogenase